MSEKKLEGLDDFWKYLQILMREQGKKEIELEPAKRDKKIAQEESTKPEEVVLGQSKPDPADLKFWMLRDLCLKLGVVLSSVRIKVFDEILPLSRGEYRMQDPDSKWGPVNLMVVSRVRDELPLLFQGDRNIKVLEFTVETKPEKYFKAETEKITEFFWKHFESSFYAMRGEDVPFYLLRIVEIERDMELCPETELDLGALFKEKCHELFEEALAAWLEQLGFENIQSSQQ